MDGSYRGCYTPLVTDRDTLHLTWLATSAR